MLISKWAAQNLFASQKHATPAPVCDLDWEPLSQCRVLSREGSDTERNEKLEKK